MEVISPGYEARDREWKRAVYARSGVAHYWVLDFEARTVTCASAPAGGRYAREETVAWADLRWPPGTGDRWGDSPTFPREGA